jgi:hypothetical protein
MGAKPDHSKQTPSVRLLGGAAVSKLTTTITATLSKNATRERCINETIIGVCKIGIRPPSHIESAIIRIPTAMPKTIALRAPALFPRRHKIPVRTAAAMGTAI